MSSVQTKPSARKIALVTGGVLALGAAVTVMFVLPAEWGIDPTGVGKATGVLALSEPPSMTAELRRGLLREGVLSLVEGEMAPEPGVKDRFTIELAPYESMELKYTVEEGKAITFHWQATGPLSYDMHGHPFEGGTDLTESYSIASANDMQGRYVAPFTGIHGWFWQNRTLEPVTLTLETSGAIVNSRTFDSSGEHERKLVSD